MRRYQRAIVVVFGVLAWTVGGLVCADEGELAAKILDEADVRGGLVVHVGCGDGGLSAALRVNDAFVVQGVDVDREQVQKARTNVRSLGLSGPVSISEWDGKHLPYADNLVNVLVLTNVEYRVPNEEIVRVLAPRGVAIFNHRKSGIKSQPLAIEGGWYAYRKPVPSDVDEWTHYLHSPGNNAVANDMQVGPPRQLQWKGGPEWARHHDHMASTVALVTAGGRLFYIMDEGPTSSIQLPAQWKLVARDAFNGKILWKKAIGAWWPHLWPNKNGLAQLPRRLVADADRVYVTLGLNAPLVELDAKTGKTLRSYTDTFATEEVIFSGGLLFVLASEPVSPPKDTDPMKMRLHAMQWEKEPRKQEILAVHADSGKTLWRIQSTVQSMTLAADQRRVYFHNGDSVVALDRTSGTVTWTSEPVPRAPDSVWTWFASTLIVHKDVVVFAGGEHVSVHRGGNDTMTALSATTGETLWSAPHPASGYDSPEDLFVINDQVWTAPLTSRKDTGLFEVRNIKTGEVTQSHPDNTGKHMPHHRCHRAKATSKYILTSRTGIEFVDTLGQSERSRHDWTRGSCLYGLMPANGLIYTPPHACACYALAKLSGFCALSSRGDETVDRPRPVGRMPETGPAYGRHQSSGARRQPSAAGHQDNSWPMYRHDPARSGTAQSRLPQNLNSLWKTRLTAPLSAPVIARGTCLIASIDTHTVHALDSVTGRAKWEFTASGRIDSPPSIHQEHVVFGTRDGWVYCLDIEDGALIWRFLAAPRDERTVVYEQVESNWPVHGSVLIQGNEVHCIAGRSMFLDGGVRYLRLDVDTGRLISETVMNDLHPETGEKLDDNITWPNLPTGLPDILSYDGSNIYMRTQAFDLEGKRLFEPDMLRPHLFSSIGLLDGSWWHRSYWTFGTGMNSGAFGWPLAGQATPAGRMLVFDDDMVYGFRRNTRHFSALTVGTWMEYHVFAMKKTPGLNQVEIREAPPMGRTRKASVPEHAWSASIPMLARAMVLTPDRLFVAGLPDILNEEELNANLNDMSLQAQAKKQADAWDGKHGGLLYALSTTDGTKRLELTLDSPPVFDGMAAADGALFVVQQNGTVLCLN